MLIPSKPLSRRTVLRAAGVALALPWLEAMQGRGLSAAEPATAAKTPPTRMLVMYAPNGMYMPVWTPAAEGPLSELPATLQPLTPHLGDFSVLSGLANKAPHLANPRGKHAPAATSFMTCRTPFPTRGRDVLAGISFDQVVAAKLGGTTRLPSLELSNETPTGTNECDAEFACVYTMTVSWRSPTIPNVPEISPRAAFQQIFGAEGAADPLATAVQGSILDLVRGEAAALNRQLGRPDQAKLDEFLHSVRETERRTQNLPKPDADVLARCPFPVAPADHVEHTKLMTDLLVLAIATDSTRVASLMLGSEYGNRSFPQIGVNDAHHGCSHHGGDKGRISNYSKINVHLVGQFAYLLEQLKARKEGDRTLLDNSVVLFGSGIGDGMSHDYLNLPIVLAGRGAGLKPGKHIRYPKDTPAANLYVTLLNRLGIEQDRFADSTGKLDGLTA